MSTLELREKLHAAIDQADDRLLNIIYALVQADIKNEHYELSEEHQRILDERLADHESDPTSGASWEEAKSRIRSKI